MWMEPGSTRVKAIKTGLELWTHFSGPCENSVSDMATVLLEY